MIGIDNINYGGGLGKNFKRFFQELIFACKPNGIVLVLATHNSSVADALLTLGTGVKPMITSIKPVRDGALVEDVYGDYMELGLYRDANCCDGEKGFEWDATLRLGDDGKRKKMLLAKMFNIKTNAEKEFFAKALKQKTLEGFIELLMNTAGISPSNSPAQTRSEDRSTPYELPTPKNIKLEPPPSLSTTPTLSTLSTSSSLSPPKRSNFM